MKKLIPAVTCSWCLKTVRNWLWFHVPGMKHYCSVECQQKAELPVRR